MLAKHVCLSSGGRVAGAELQRLSVHVPLKNLQCPFTIPLKKFKNANFEANHVCLSRGRVAD